MKKKWLFFLICSSLFVACTNNRLDLDENHIYITSKVQTKIVTIGNLMSAGGTSPDLEKGSDDQWFWVKNEWIKCSISTNGKDRERLKITVAENPTIQSRTIQLRIISRINSEILTITQLGSTGNKGN